MYLQSEDMFDKTKSTRVDISMMLQSNLWTARVAVKLQGKDGIKTLLPTHTHKLKTKLKVPPDVRKCLRSALQYEYSTNKKAQIFKMTRHFQNFFFVLWHSLKIRKRSEAQVCFFVKSFHYSLKNAGLWWLCQQEGLTV